MNEQIFYTPDGNPALDHARRELESRGTVFVSEPQKDVTHLLLGVPAFHDDGTLKGNVDGKAIFSQISRNATVFGGNLRSPALSDFQTVDLLQDPLYLAHNADITAHCAVKVAMQHLPVIIKECPILILGWGRIGKCLSSLLHRMGSDVTVAARKDADRAMISALGYTAADIHALRNSLGRYRVIFNTVPEQILREDAICHCSENCLKIDLASRKGIDGEDVIHARGLPGKDAPESSGKLIAETVLRLMDRR